MKLHPHQQKLLDLNPKRHILGWDCRLGKTIGILELCKQNNISALIVVPKHLKENWIRNADQYNKDHLIVTKEELRINWDTLPAKKSFIADESHMVCGAGKNGKGSQVAQAVQSYLQKHDIRYRYFLSATPVNADITSAYVLLRHLGEPISYWKFVNTFFYKVRMGFRFVPKVKPDAYKGITELLKPFGTFLKMEEVIDLPEETDIVEYFTLQDSQIKAIKKIEEPISMVRYNKIHQIENFALKGDGYIDDVFFDSYKLDRIVDLVSENDKTIVFCKYRLQIKAIQDALGKVDIGNKQIFVIHGDVKNRDEIILKAEKAQKAVIIIITECSTGYELATFSLVVFASLPWSYTHYYQCRGRIKTIDPNKVKRNTYITLLNNDGIDQDVLDNLSDKKDFHLDLFLKKT